MYPRPQHCVTHHIPTSIISCYHKYNETDLVTALTYLREPNTFYWDSKIAAANLVKGDLVIFDGDKNHHTVIFDGQKLIHLDNEFYKYGSLPSIFHVIEDGVPINYWAHIDETITGIDNNSIVWFNHHIVYKQCLQNLNYAMIQGNKYAIYTTFQYNNLDYRIIFDYPKFVDENKIDDESYQFHNDKDASSVYTRCKKILKEANFPFDHDSESYKESVNNHTLFMRIYP